MNLKIAILGSIFFISNTLFATEDLQSIYTLALTSDPTLQASEAAMESGKLSVPIAVSRFLPTLSGTANTVGHNDTGNFQGEHYNTHGYSINLTQPIWHREYWALYEQAKNNKNLSIANYALAIQDLILRVSERYFNVLAAQDEVSFTRAQRKAFERQLEQTSQRFEVGLIAVTDVDEARARRDEARANEIAAENDVADRFEQLREITGSLIDQLAPLNASALKLTPPLPNQMNDWVVMANEQNLDLEIARARASIAYTEIENQAAGHWPTLDANAGFQRNYDGRSTPPFTTDTISRTASLAINIPILQGGNVVYRTRQARANYDQAQKNAEVQLRSTFSLARQSFRGVLTEISRVNALQQSVVSNKSALQATQAAYDAGTRTIVDVLDAETNLLRAVRDLAQARYRYILEGLRLKKAAGVLNNSDIILVNQLLQSYPSTSTVK